MSTLRKCAKCHEPAMSLVARRMQLYNSVYQYKCTNCEQEVELTPIASLGVQITIGLLVAVVFWVIFFGDNSGFDAISLTLYILVVAILPVLALLQLLKHRAYPLVDSDADLSHLMVEESTSITKKPVIWVEKLSFLGGLLAPIVLIVVVLGSAFIIGYINFTYF